MGVERKEPLPVIHVDVENALSLQGPTEDHVILALREALQAITAEFKAYTEEERKQVSPLTAS